MPFVLNFWEKVTPAVVKMKPLSKGPPTSVAVWVVREPGATSPCTVSTGLMATVLGVYMSSPLVTTTVYVRGVVEVGDDPPPPPPPHAGASSTVARTAARDR